MGFDKYSNAGDLQTEASVVADITRQAETVQTFQVGNVQVFRNPKNGEISRFDEHRITPHRHHNVKLKAADVDSFVGLVKHYQPLPRVLHFLPEHLRMVCVLNHSAGETPNWHDATISWQLHLDPFLKSWKDMDGKWISQTALLELLEERIEDVVQNTDATQALPPGPSQSQLMSVVSDLRITTDSTFTSKKDLANGNYVFQSSRNDKPEVEVPSLFYVGLPFFEGDSKAHFLFPIRLRYRLQEGGKLVFQLVFHNWDKIRLAAWDGVTTTVKGPLADLPAFTMAAS
jgi:uncharacterized protein YfdQ (DUF2303 family)